MSTTWTPQSKPSTSWTPLNKPSTSWSPASKPSTSWSAASKPTTSWTNINKPFSADVTEYLLLQSGDFLLQQNGSKLIKLFTPGSLTPTTWTNNQKT